MQASLIKKYEKLSEECDWAFMKQPHLYDYLPKNCESTIVVALEGDDEFNAYSRSLVPNLSRKVALEARKRNDTWIITPITARARKVLGATI